MASHVGSVFRRFHAFEATIEWPRCLKPHQKVKVLFGRENEGIFIGFEPYRNNSYGALRNSRFYDQFFLLLAIPFCRLVMPFPMKA
jgi:hypothetical protein